MPREMPSWQISARTPTLEAGRDTARIMPATLCSLYAGIDWKHPEYGEDYRAVDLIRAEVREKLLPQAISDGHFTQPDRFMPGMNKIGQTLGGLNGGHVFNLNALRCKSLTEGMMFGRKLAHGVYGILQEICARL